MRRLRLVSGLSVALFFASSAVLFPQQDRAAEILARARELIGGEARLKAVQSISVSASASLQSASRLLARGGVVIPLNHTESSYPVSIEIVLPDRFLVDRDRHGREDGFNGSELITRSHGAPNEVEGDRRIGTGFLQRDFLRYMLVWLLEVPDQFNVRFSDGGTAEVDGTPVDMVYATGTPEFSVRLFFDEQGRLLALNDCQPPVAGLRSQADAAGQAAAKSPPPPLFRSLEPAPTEGTGGVHMRLADYRVDDGISFPHRVTAVTDGYRHEEWRIKRFKVNPKINPKDFDPR